MRCQNAAKQRSSCWQVCLHSGVGWRGLDRIPPFPAISSSTRKVYGVVTVKETSRRTECHEGINSMGKRALAGYHGKLLAPALVNL